MWVFSLPGRPLLWFVSSLKPLVIFLLPTKGFLALGAFL